jgi:hypothetical protein
MANDWSDHCVGEITADARRDKIREVNLAGFGVITVWGVAKWDYFSGSFRTSAEGWFQNDTRSGGADKLGHLYTSYVTAHGLSGLYEYACFSKNDAAFYGALSSFAITAYMELGDSFSNFGFSNEDLVANALGSVLGYYLYKDPGLSSKIDLRWEYGFHPEGNDFTTDYENSKYLVALKLNGFAAFRHSFLKHFELQLGYYTRGFSDVVETNERNLFIGIGLNLTDLFRRHGYTKTATLLNYLQVPGANIEFEHDLNR